MQHDQDKKCLDDSLIVDTSITPFNLLGQIPRSLLRLLQHM